MSINNQLARTPPMGWNSWLCYATTVREDDVRALHRASENNRELFERGDCIAWIADVPDSADKYLAVFNVGDDGPASIEVSFADLGLPNVCRVRDLWAHQDLDCFEGRFTPRLESHAAGLYRLTPLNTL